MNTDYPKIDVHGWQDAKIKEILAAQGCYDLATTGSADLVIYGLDMSPECNLAKQAAKADAVLDGHATSRVLILALVEGSTTEDFDWAKRRVGAASDLHRYLDRVSYLSSKVLYNTPVGLVGLVSQKVSEVIAQRSATPLVEPGVPVAPQPAADRSDLLGANPDWLPPLEEEGRDDNGPDWVDRVDALTAEQEAAMEGHMHRWLALAHSTEPANWRLSEEGIRECYRYIDSAYPEGRYVTVSSPAIGGFAFSAAAQFIHMASEYEGPSIVARPTTMTVHELVSTVHHTVGQRASNPEAGKVLIECTDATVRACLPELSALLPRLDDRAAREFIAQAVNEMPMAVRRLHHRYLGGQWWLGWQAHTSYFRDVCFLRLPGDLWSRDRAYARAQSYTGWWWPHRNFVLVCDRPEVMAVEKVPQSGWASYRLHQVGGPALRWRDGTENHFWHGLPVPEWVSTNPTVDKIGREQNVEVRRAGIESMGWDRFVLEAELKLIDTKDDPGNPGEQIKLYKAGDAWGGDEDTNVAIVTNGTPERDGSRRKFGLIVDARFTDAIAAIADTYDDTQHPIRMTPEMYTQLARRT